ncbi:MAG: helix-turn-helix domain-containing protein [Chloroflexota bacterium]
MNPSEPIQSCPVESTIDAIGGKYKPLILFYLLEDQVLRFGELHRKIPHATRRMLTKHLRELEADGLLHREVYQQVPPKVEYSLTHLGLSLKPVMEAMLAWGLFYTREKESLHKEEVAS